MQVKEHFVLKMRRGPHVCKLYSRSKDTFTKFSERLAYLTAKPDWTKKYQVMEKLGAGSFATVFKVFNREDLQLYAMKLLDKKKFESLTSKINLLNELRMLFSLDHKAIVKVYEFYEKESEFTIIMEYVAGPQIFSKLVSEKRIFSESEAARIVFLILEGLQYMHGKKIIHRDLKLENVMFADPVEETVIKIVDFGFAVMLGAKHSQTKCGTPGYVAPEVLLGQKYNEKADIFSLGIMFFMMLSRNFPFPGRDFQEVLKNNMNCKLNFCGSRWENIAESAKNLVRHMTAKNQDERFTHHQILQDPWFIYTSSQNEKTIFDLEKKKLKAAIMYISPLPPISLILHEPNRRKRTTLKKEEEKNESKDEDGPTKKKFYKMKTMGGARSPPRRLGVPEGEKPILSSPVQWGKNKFERQKSNVKMSNIENLNKFVILQNIKRKYKESSVENNEESESFFIAADFELDKFYINNSKNYMRSQKSMDETVKHEESVFGDDEYIPEEFTAIQRHRLVELENYINMARINKLIKEKSGIHFSLKKQFHSAPSVRVNDC